MASLFLVVFVLLLPTSAFASEFWYMNCGSSNGFTDGNNITWYGDDPKFVRSGEGFEIQQGQYRGTFLRAFPEKNRKNCYTFPVGKDKKVQVKVVFYYGNYDGKGKPPTFQLMFDTTDWAEVDLSKFGDEVEFWVAIYITKSNDTKVCFGRLYDDQDPIVNIIAVSVLGPGIYSQVNSSNALYKPVRYAFGTNQTIRYPFDPYDRAWFPTDNTSGIVTEFSALKSNASSVVHTSASVDDPPARLFDNAISPIHGENNLTITTTFLDTDPTPIYLNMYFSEIFNLTGSEKKNRSFHIYKDNDRITNASDPITPPYGSVFEFTGVNLEASQNTTFTLASEHNSSLPPVISGIEVLMIREFFAAVDGFS